MNEALKQFIKLGKDASYHYADDSGKEWGLANGCVRQAMELYKANPELRALMREEARGFLWASDFTRQANEIDNGE